MPKSQQQINNISENKDFVSTEIMVHLIENENMTITSAANKLGVNKSTVSKRLKAINYVPGYLKNFDNAEVAILKQIRQRILNALATKDLKKARLTELTTAYGTLIDKQYMIEGKPTETIAYFDIVKAEEEAAKRIQAFESKYLVEHDKPETQLPPN